MKYAMLLCFIGLAVGSVAGQTTNCSASTGSLTGISTLLNGLLSTVSSNGSCVTLLLNGLLSGISKTLIFNTLSYLLNNNN